MFRIGQKVVAKTTSNNWRKGDEFIVRGIKKAPCCGDLLLNLHISGTIVVCNKHTKQQLGIDWWDAKCFEPIVDISFGEEVTSKIEQEFEIGEPLLT